MTATILNVRKLILDKYDCDMCRHDHELMDEEETHDGFDVDWVQIYRIEDRYFKVWGCNLDICEDCVEVFQKKEMREIISYHEKTNN